MRILHCCLSNYYVDKFAYQENELVAAQIREGHEVLVIASTETFGADKSITYLEPSDYLGSDGARVIRLPYKRFCPKKIMRKLRMHPDVAKTIESFKPDTILFHGTCGWELITVSNYVKRHPDVRLYVDSHEDYNNSARNFISKWLLHFLYYRTVVRYCSRWINKILCVNIDSMFFLQDLYGLKAQQLEFFPLGGKIFHDDEYKKMRQLAREKLGFDDSEIVFLQSGKINRSKKLLQSLLAFREISEGKFRFIIAGTLEQDVSNEAQEIIASDSRIRHLGWLNPEELQSALCAADIYVQPGTQSATMQMSLCCRCAIVIDDNISHKPYLKTNGWLINSDASLKNAFREIAASPDIVKVMSENSALLAAELLDYRKLSKRICV
jgi:1,2-diacylglycerol 3-alpha-glucosyltransferase